MKVIEDHFSQLNVIVKQNRVLFFIMIFIGIVLGISLYFYLIRLTHRISGPIYVLSRHVKDVIDGKDPDLRELRKNDEFKEFYNEFAIMVSKITERRS